MFPVAIKHCSLISISLSRSSWWFLSRTLRRTSCQGGYPIDGVPILEETCSMKAFLGNIQSYNRLAIPLIARHYGAPSARRHLVKQAWADCSLVDLDLQQFTTEQLYPI